MKKRILSVLTALALCLTMLPTAAWAAEPEDEPETVEVTTPDGLEINGTTVTKYTGTATELTIPDGVTEIGVDAFRGNSTLTSVILPESVTTVDDRAFADMSSLQSVVMPGVTSIGEDAFRNVKSLTSATMPQVKEIGVQAFEYTALTEVELPEVLTISDCAFRGSALESIDMPKVETIGERAFEKNKFASFTVPDSVKKFGKQILYDVSPETLTISLHTLLTAEFDQLTFSNTFYTYKDYEIILTGVDQDITLLENGVETSEKSVTFEKGVQYDAGFHITTVKEATGGTVTNQTGQSVTVNGETVPNNSVKPVGTDTAAGDAYLADLYLSATYILPDFANLTTAYTAMVDYTVASTDVTAVPSNREATVTINGVTVTSDDDYTVEIPLNEGNNDITVVVTALNGSAETTYMIALEKMPAPASVQIGTPEELMAFAEAVNNGEYNNVTGVVVELTDNINLEGYDWTPIGDTEYNYFSGTFEGNGYTISNLTINKTTTSGYFGLFGVTDAAIQNVNVSGTLKNTAPDTGSCIGAVAGRLAGGTIKNCNTSGFTISSEVTLGICVGGIVGEADYSVIENCVSGTDISILPYGYVGGVAGAAVETRVINCTYNGTICFSSGSYVDCGGIVGSGQENSEIAYCTNNGSIDVSQRTGAGNTTIGGIVGGLSDSSQIHHSTNTGDLNGLAIRMGGITGIVSDRTVDNCLNSGTINSTAQSGSTYVGGIAATVGSSGSVTNCVSVGSVTGGTSGHHPITSYAENGSEFSNNYYDSALTSSDAVPDSVTSGSTGVELSSINSGDMVDQINEWGGAYRLGADGKIEIIPLSYVLTIEGSTADASGAGEYEMGAQVAIDAGSRSGYRFAGWTVTSGSGELADAASAQTTFTMPAEDVTLTASWKAVSSSGGGGSSGSSASTNKPTVEKTENGSATVSPKNPKQGDTVTITVTPDPGYEVDTVTVTDKNGDEIRVKDKGDGVYTFTMPASKVTVAATFIKLAENAPVISFLDVSPNDWFAEAAVYAAENNIMVGNNGYFLPNEPLTRGMIAQILYNLEGGVGTFALTYSDVSAADWCADAVAFVSAHGIMTGYGGTTRFGANDAITREQLALTLYQYAKAKGHDVSATVSLDSFADGHTTSDWAKPAMRWAVANGLISGKSGNLLDPQGTATRAEVASILMRFCEIPAK